MHGRPDVKGLRGNADDDGRRRDRRYSDIQEPALDETESTGERSQSTQVVVFAVGAEEYALPISQVHEIIRYTAPRAVASRLEWVRGVVTLRGRILPVCDLAARLGLKPSEQAPGKIVVAETAQSVPVGIVVDDVVEVLALSADQVQTLEAPGTELVRAIGKLGERLIVLLDSTRIFDGGEHSLAA